MISLLNYKRQHNAINEEISFLETEIQKEKVLIDLNDVNFHIGKLTALLRIHLLEENTNLYPVLLSSLDEGIKNLANQYMLEMGKLIDDYTIFKCTYTEKRMSERMDEFIKEAEDVIKAIKVRFTKEENELYQIVSVEA
jgi:hemerythrin-like domain-containing protein